MAKCESCGQEIGTKKVCPYCGTRQLKYSGTTDGPDMTFWMKDIGTVAKGVGKVANVAAKGAGKVVNKVAGEKLKEIAVEQQKKAMASFAKGFIGGLGLDEIKNDIEKAKNEAKTTAASKKAEKKASKDAEKTEKPNSITNELKKNFNEVKKGMKMPAGNEARNAAGVNMTDELKKNFSEVKKGMKKIGKELKSAFTQLLKDIKGK